jgi:hypothetical protein
MVKASFLHPRLPMLIDAAFETRRATRKRAAYIIGPQAVCGVPVDLYRPCSLLYMMYVWPPKPEELCRRVFYLQSVLRPIAGNFSLHVEY